MNIYYIIYVQIELVVYIILVYIDDFNIKLNNVINMESWKKELNNI